MKKAVYFATPNCLDDEKIRELVVRIPQVSLKIKEAQEIFDEMGLDSFDLFSYLRLPKEKYLKNTQAQALVCGLVQVGLYERYLKNNSLPDYIIASEFKESASMVCMGLESTEQLIFKSRLIEFLTKSNIVEENKTVAPLSVSSQTTVLSRGVVSSSFEVYKRKANSGSFERLYSQIYELETIVNDLSQEHPFIQIIHIGPGDEFKENQMSEVASEKAQVLNSIELDPLLNWFYSDAKLAYAQ